MPRKPVDILHVEDDDDDADLMSRALSRTGVNHVLIRVADATEAITYLTNQPRPDLVLLDLKLPRVNGFDVLAFIRAKPELQGLPVIVFTGSEFPNDMEKAKALGATDYLLKNVDWKVAAMALQASFSQFLQI